MFKKTIRIWLEGQIYALHDMIANTYDDCDADKDARSAAGDVLEALQKGLNDPRLRDEVPSS